MKSQYFNLSSYDYIIVGAGSAGSLIANRLSANPRHSVLLVEAGPISKNFWLKLPIGYYKTMINPKFAREFLTESHPGTAGRQIVWPRGRVLGGSSAINGLVFMRGQKEDFNDWCALGAPGWTYSEVLPFFRRLENFQGGNGQYHGALGEMSVSNLRNDNACCHAWLKAAQEYGLPYNEDFNAHTTYGVGSYQLSITGRWRSSAASAYLLPIMHRSNLTVLTEAFTNRILFRDKRAYGIEWTKNGKVYRAEARSEIILSAGTIQSPQILQLSGVGPKNLLQKFGIPVVVNAPSVGQNLQDHYQMRLVVRLKGGGSLNTESRNPLNIAKWAMEWLLNASGPLTVGAGQVGGGACTKFATNNRPDVQLFIMPLSLDKAGDPLHKFPGFTAVVWQCHPKSRGQVNIVSSNPFEQPKIEPNYFLEKDDRKVMVEGVKILRKIFAQPSFRNLWDTEIIPGAQFTEDQAIWEQITKSGTTVYHPVGTCRMGTDPEAVVDPDLKVRGVLGLRVIDASVMPKITSANTNAPTLMIAEKGTNAILMEQI